MENRHIVIFDGVCNFCNGAVNFIIERDPQGIFVFTPMQCEFARQLLNQYKIETVGMDTFVLIKQGECLVFSSAALEISKDLTGLWYLFTVFGLVPRFVRDNVYRAFARNRYRLFGKQATCRVPSKELKSRFIGI